jgi:UDP-N-acetylmuramoyl-L-alanyl-D-glutamate--2,6-diaminopimelate ligase
MYHVLLALGKKVSVISTVYAKVGKKTYDTGLHVTSPHSSVVQQLLRQSADSGDEYFVMEVTSHGIDQHRVGGVNYEVGMITNVTHEHLDYHKTYEKYLAVKSQLLLRSKVAIINRDDQSYVPLKKILDTHHKTYKTYGLENEATYNLNIADKLQCELSHFNLYNYLAVYAAAKCLGLDETNVLEAMKTYVLPPGRMEVVYDGKYRVIVDFAHTPNAVHEALSAIKKQLKNPDAKLIHVFGCAGLRDREKRPMMGEESATYADITIITEEDYRTEDINTIAKEISLGLKKNGFVYESPEKLTSFKQHAYTIIHDRRGAIEKALELAREGDVVIMTGKGHEKSLCRGKKEYPWSDQEAVRNILKLS